MASQASTWSGSTQASWTQVIPAAANSAETSARAAACSAGPGAGSRSSTGPMAPHSRRVPSGDPSGRRTIWPAAGSGVPASRPARRSASLLTHMVWWSIVRSATGRPATTESSQRASNRPPSASVGSNASPVTHSASGCAAAQAATAARISATLRAWRTGTPRRPSPPSSGCACPSPNEGSSAPPARSVTSVLGPRASSASWPSASTRPPATASAVLGCAPGTPVRTVPPVNSWSACIAIP